MYIYICTYTYTHISTSVPASVAARLTLLKRFEPGLLSKGGGKGGRGDGSRRPGRVVMEFTVWAMARTQNSVKSGNISSMCI